MKFVKSQTMIKYTSWVIICIFSSFISFAQSFEYTVETEEEYYEIIDIPIPEHIILEVGGMTNLPNGNIAICTRRGEVWIVSNTENLKPTFKKFAHGLHEPLGISFKEGALYVAQRGELTKLVDRNGDGIADLYERITSWPLSGNYHEYSYGPALLPNGNFMVNLNLGWVDRLGQMESLVPWRGWVVEITPSGDIIPIASGLRSPAGYWVNDEGDYFYSENQGDWVGSGRISHVEKGDFLGNPKGLKWIEDTDWSVSIKPEDIPDTGGSMVDVAKDIASLKLPAVWLPHGIMGTSTSDFLFDNNQGEFGPFDGQVFIGDQGQSKVMRMDLEKVNGEYQGAIFPFREGFSSGVFRMVWGNDNSMIVGMTSRGWSSTGSKLYGLQKVIWNGKVPFEMKTIKATSKGFLIKFTHPVDPATALDLNAYEIVNFNYKYQARYGSPVVHKGSCPVQSVRISEDGYQVSLVVDSLKPGYIHELKLQDIISSSGKTLLHDVGYYTLNNIPENVPGIVTASKESLSDGIQQSLQPEPQPKPQPNPKPQSHLQPEPPRFKRQTTIPPHWNGHVDQSLVVGTKPGLKFDIQKLTLKAGSRVRLVFQNTDDMLHNLVIVQPNSAIKVGEMALNLGLDGLSRQYIPDTDMVLFYTNLLEPGMTETIYFQVPEEPGEYEYVCTVPGHYFAMRGLLLVVK